MRKRLSKVMSALADSTLKAFCFSAMVGLGAAAVEYVAHALAMRIGFSELAHALFDSVLIGVSAGILMWFLLLAMHMRRGQVLHRVRVISELNHNIRNALQVIVSSHYMSRPQQTEVIMESVRRIEQTLREFFPSIGEREEDRERPAPRVISAGRLRAERRRGTGDR